MTLHLDKQIGNNFYLFWSVGWLVGIYILLHLIQEQNVQITLVICIIVFHIGRSNLFPFFLGYRDAEGFVTLSVSFDTDPCLSVMVVTR